MAVAPLGQRLLRGDITTGQIEAGLRGGAGTFRRTIVQTVSRSTGAVVKEETFRGAPFLMNHDITVAKKVFRVASKLHGRLPRKPSRRRVIDAPPLSALIQERVLSNQLSCPK